MEDEFAFAHDEESEKMKGETIAYTQSCSSVHFLSL